MACLSKCASASSSWNRIWTLSWCFKCQRLTGMSSDSTRHETRLRILRARTLNVSTRRRLRRRGSKTFCSLATLGGIQFEIKWSHRWRRQSSVSGSSAFPWQHRFVYRSMMMISQGRSLVRMRDELLQCRVAHNEHTWWEIMSSGRAPLHTLALH